MRPGTPSRTGVRRSDAARRAASPIRAWAGGGLLAAVALLTGCASGWPVWVASDGSHTAASSDAAPALDPTQRYLRARLGEREVFLVLGEVDPHPRGPTEVWFGGEGEMVKLRQGRVVGTAGLPVDWRAVRFDHEPPWPAPADASSNTRMQRERDLMPGYRAGIRDRLVRVAVAAPADAPLSNAPLRWFEERSSTAPRTAALPPARYAVSDRSGQPEVVLTEQCLTPDWCLRLERVTPPGASMASTLPSAPARKALP